MIRLPSVYNRQNRSHHREGGFTGLVPSPFPRCHPFHGCYVFCVSLGLNKESLCGFGGAWFFYMFPSFQFTNCSSLIWYHNPFHLHLIHAWPLSCPKIFFKEKNSSTFPHKAYLEIPTEENENTFSGIEILEVLDIPGPSCAWWVSRPLSYQNLQLVDRNL